MTGVTLDRYENRATGTSFHNDVTDRFATWSRSIRAIGGYAYAESEYIGNGWELQNFYDTALLNRIVERGDGVQTFEGFVGELIMTYSNGDKVQRSIVPWYDRVRVIYSKIFPNLIIDGSVDIGLWTDINACATFEVSPLWWTRGTQGMHIITNAPGQGAQIENGAAPAAIVIQPSRAYDVSVDIKVDAGTWTLYVYQSGTATVIASRAAVNDGEETLQVQIPETNTIASVDVELIDSSGAGEIWADNAVLQLVSIPATTTWYEEESAILTLGTKELIVSMDGMSDAAARALAQQTLAKSAWPISRAAPEPILVSLGEEQQVPAEAGPVSLMVSVYGYMHTLKWKYVATTSGINTITNQLTALLAESEFITAGSIATNTTNQKIETQKIPRTLWSIIKKMVESGEDGDTTPYMGGVYNARQFRYEQRPTTISMFRDGSMVTGLSGEIIPPYKLRPGLLQLVGTSQTNGPTGLDRDRPDVVFIEEVKYNAASNTAELVPSKDEL